MSARAAVVWLHGLGDTGRGWSDIERQMGRALSAAVGGPVKWVFPTAPVQRVSCNGGAPCTSWMDLDEIPVKHSSTDFESDIRKSIAIVHKLIDEVVAEGVPSEKIVVGGFSQGGATSLLATLNYPSPLAGGIVLSGWAACSDKWEGDLASEANKKTPLFWGHGSADNVVLPECQVEGVKLLKAAGYEVADSVYAGMAHASCPEEMQDVVETLARFLK